MYCKKIYCLLVVLLAVILCFGCGKKSFDEPFSGDVNNPFAAPNPGLNEGLLQRVLVGNALPSDLEIIAEKFKGINYNVESGDTENSTIVIPYNGKLLSTLRDNDAGWLSELHMVIGDEDIVLFEDTRKGPLNKTTEFSYAAGTSIGFYLITYAATGEVWTNYASGDYCNIEYYEESIKWKLQFEDDMGPNSDFDFNDCVIEVQMIPDAYVDLSDYLDISVEYLNPHGYTSDGLAIYYIGEKFNYNVNIDVTQDSLYFGNSTYIVYAIQEYYEDYTCDRWWYPGEPKLISVKKGDELPNQNPCQSWSGITFSYPGSQTLTGSYQSTLEVAAGNDQTHIIIVAENEIGQIEITVYDNPEAGVFDPPPAQN